MNITKDQIVALLDKWIRQRSGMDWRDYGDFASARSEARRISRQGSDAKMLLREVELSGITADDLLKAFRAYSGRLEVKQDGDKFRLEYCAGQYFPTEYRAAVCAVLAQALWDYHRPDYMNDEHPGDSIRAMFKRRYGRRIASTWFD